jgi:outer membrane cobalamin receptor
MKALLIIIVWLLVFGGVNAQGGYRFSGRVLDSATRQPVAFASVSAFTPGPVAFKSVIADSLGVFRLEGMPADRYFLVINAVGYRKFILPQPVLADAAGNNTAVYWLTRDTGMLTAVTITGAKPLVSPSVDGFSYNAANDIIPAGLTAGDLLRRIPMLSVNQQGGPMLRGSSNIRVFIDDKPSDVYAASVADALQQVPAADIERIEVTLYPSARYEAEGTDGVINIITRRSRFDATNGILRIQLANRRQNINPDLNIRRGNWIGTVNSGFQIYDNQNSGALWREDRSGSEKQLLQQESRWDNNGRIFYIGGNVIYVFNDLQNISGGYRFRFNRDYTSRQADNYYFVNNSLLNTFTRHTNPSSGNDLHTFNLAYSGKSRDRKRQFNLLVTQFFQTGSDEYDLDQLRSEVIDYKELFRGAIDNKELLLQADYQQQVNDRINWDAGARSTFRRYGSFNDFSVYDFPTDLFVKDDNRSNAFDYRRDIHAVYSNMVIRLKTWQVRVGARYEHTLLQADFKDTALTVPDFKNLVPNVLVSKTFNRQHTLKWSYGKRITRPFLGAINPAANYSDSLNIQAGNPYLQPEITNRYEMGYTYAGKRITLMASLYYNATREAIEQVRLPLDGKVFLNTWRNLGKNDVWVSAFSITGKWTKLSLTVTTNLRRLELESKALQLSRTGYQFSGNVSCSYLFNKGYSVEVLGAGGSPDITLQGKREVWQFYGLVLNKKFKGDKFSMSLRADNFLMPPNVALRQTTDMPHFTQYTDTRYQSRYFALSATLKFGKKEVKAPVVRQDGGGDN